jgi:peroxiredoxin family protein
MSTEIAAPASAELEQQVHALVDEYLARKEAEAASRPKKMAIIASKGTLDMAYPPLILASTAAALGWEVAIFFTFYGLNIIHREKGKKLAVAPLGNPAAPIPVPNLMGAVPGMTAMATTVMKRMFRSHGVASLDQLMEAAIDCGVRLIPCSMTIEVFGYKDGDFLPEAEPSCGAANFLAWAGDADVSLFI